MHWKLEKCPTTWHEIYIGHCREPTINYKGGAFTRSLGMTCLFRMPRPLNDINVLDRSLVFVALAKGRVALAYYTIIGPEYAMRYYLAYEIYLNWWTFVKTIPRPLRAKRKYFTSKQESTRKDVERAFRVLQSHFIISRGPMRYWDEETLANIMKTCTI